MAPDPNSTTAFQETFGPQADIRNIENPTESDTTSFMEKAMSLLSKGKEFASVVNPIDEFGAESMALLMDKRPYHPSNLQLSPESNVTDFSPKCI